MTQVIDKMRLMYLHKVLNRNNDHWTKQMMNHLKNPNIGWTKNIQEKHTKYEMETNWEIIGRKSKAEWKKEVERAVDKQNNKKLIEDCTSKTKNGIKINTKSKSIHEKLISPEYKRQPLKEIIHGTKQRTKTLLLARHGMLECGANLKGTIPEMCRKCNVVDNEYHRINECRNYTQTNLADSLEKCKFSEVYSEDESILDKVIENLERVWELKKGGPHGRDG